MTRCATWRQNLPKLMQACKRKSSQSHRPDFSGKPACGQLTTQDFFNQGLAKHTMGDLDGAIADYNQAIRLTADIYYNRGLAKQTKGDFDEAIVDYSEAIRINPKRVSPYYNRGLAKQGGDST
jgi:tetratricopeptide (TPR) repeat protein